MDERERGASPPASGAIDLAARYRSLFEIGRGGMGTIEVALEKNARGFERIVALKRLHPHSARERRGTEAFVREARLAVWLVHPNVVHAFDFGQIDSELFLAMEYVEGETLSAIIRTGREQTRGPLPPELVASILADACEGLHAAHELRDPTSGARLNVIHRDVSPHNVMVSYEGHVKLLDFGVAKMDSVDPLTRTGEVKGKTAYMSPEQAMGDPLDRRSDLFSVGAVLFECVAGRRMWGNGTDLDVMRKLALESPPSLADAAPLAPRELVDLCARLVARSPADRPASARAVADELRAFAAKAEPKVDTGAVAGVMQALFASEARRRKELLDRALEEAGPSARVEVLRRSLAGPTALAALSRPPPPPTRAPDAPAYVPAAREPRGESIAPRATRSGVIVSAIVGLVIALVIVAATNARAPHAAISPPPAPAPPSPSVTLTTPLPAATSAPSVTPSLASPEPPPPTPDASPASSGTPRPASSAPSRRHHPKPVSTIFPLDVDSNPL